MRTLTRAETPTQSPTGELNLLGVFASVDGSTCARRPLPCRNSSAGEFSVKKTSAAECEPSVAICPARMSSSPLSTSTLMPVAFSKPDTRASVVSSC